eukprot:CAMPEP_0115129868 /NCGR_PEP_ID=MMETSP0227-20121206/52076_1 /TAXON_ID=89957 /ORGANISM="Polarella glacialis, Strain CCMP 1383" /LENGTH=357 /DNA_ID=CAMNT_0002534877 /DNA_START=84 /DNA_END=1157 /DNA_ORIENTATION=+
MTTIRYTLHCFGHIVQVTDLPGPEGGLLVLYADAQAAANARESFGLSTDEITADLAVKLSTDEITADLAVKLSTDEITADLAVKLSTDEITADLAVKLSTDEITADLAVKLSTDEITADLAVKLSADDIELAVKLSAGIDASASTTASLPLMEGSEAEDSAEDGGSVAGSLQRSDSGSLEESQEAKKLEGTSLKIPTASSPTSTPKKVQTFQLSQLNWDQLDKKQEWRTALQLRGLPKRLCDQRAFEALLTSCGLMGSVDKVEVLPPSRGSRVGSAIIHAKYVAEVPKVAKYFHGGMFQGSASPVAVSFATDQGQSGAVKSSSFRSSSSLKLAEPHRIHSSFGIAPPPGLECHLRSC